MNKKATEAAEFPFWLILVILAGLLIIIIFFSYLFPGIWETISGMSDKYFKIETPVKSQEELSEEGKKAVTSFGSIVDSIESCRKTTKKSCLCDLYASELNEDYVISFEATENGYIAYIFKGKSYTQNPQYILASHEFKDMNLCTTMYDRDTETLVSYEEQRFNIYSDNGVLTFVNIPVSMGKDYFIILGASEEDEKEGVYKLFKFDDKHVCFIINRKDKDSGWIDVWRYTNDIRNIIKNIENIKCR